MHDHLLQRLGEMLPVGVLQVDTRRRVVFTNDQLHTVLRSPRDCTLEELLATVIDADRVLADTAFDAVLDGSERDVDIELRVESLGPDDRAWRRCLCNLRALTSSDGEDGEDGEVTGAIVCVSEVGADHRTEDQPRRHASFDALTRCTDRDSTLAALEAMLAAADREAMPAAVYVNVDHFRDLNHDHGLAAGDEFLGVVARRLHGMVREDDLVGRIGGDEFLVVCSRIATAAAAMRKAITIAESLRHEIQLKDVRVASQASIGVAWPSGPETDVATLVAQAHGAMVESKRRGAGRPVLFTASLANDPPPP